MTVTKNTRYPFDVERSVCDVIVHQYPYRGEHVGIKQLFSS